MGYSPFYFLGQAFKNLKRNCGIYKRVNEILINPSLLGGEKNRRKHNVGDNGMIVCFKPVKNTAIDKQAISLFKIKLSDSD